MITDDDEKYEQEAALSQVRPRDAANFTFRYVLKACMRLPIRP